MSAVNKCLRDGKSCLMTSTDKWQKIKKEVMESKLQQRDAEGKSARGVFPDRWANEEHEHQFLTSNFGRVLAEIPQAAHQARAYDEDDEGLAPRVKTEAPTDDHDGITVSSMSTNRQSVLMYHLGVDPPRGVKRPDYAISSDSDEDGDCHGSDSEDGADSSHRHRRVRTDASNNEVKVARRREKGKGAAEDRELIVVVRTAPKTDGHEMPSWQCLRGKWVVVTTA